MSINKDSLKARVKNISEKTGVSANIIYPLYFYECFLKRLSYSKYRDCFVLKGGFFLSTLFGIENRSTIDIDFCIRNIGLTKDRLEQIVNEIIAVGCDDAVEFKIIDVSPIRPKDLYGGFSFTINGKLDNVNINFMIDFATGDPITPKPAVYKYTSRFDSSKINLKSYPLETVVAEKLETVLEKGLSCSRLKDYYDLYYVQTYKIDIISKTVLSAAIKNTFKYRNFTITKNNAIELINKISHEPRFHMMWESFKNKKHYANQITFDEIALSIKEWFEYLP